MKTTSKLIRWWLLGLLGLFIIAQTARSDGQTIYMPLVFKAPGEIVPLPPPLPPPIIKSGTPPLNFTQIRTDAQKKGLDLAFNKVGFHVGMGGNTAGLFEMLTELDAAGVPFVLKSADNASAIYFAQELMKQSGVPHVLIYRRATGISSVPDYNLLPAEAARQHWAAHKAIFPPELDKNLVWLETMNEVDKGQIDSGWMGQFAQEMAKLTLTDGYKWAAFGWSGGEPEPAQWAEPAMRDFLRLAGRYPDQLAIAVHEYSFVTDSITRWYPWLVGRFQLLFDVCDQYGLRRPTVLITEWGWAERNVPDVAPAMSDIAWAAWLYAAYPQVKGAAIWYLGPGFGEIDDQTQRLIAPLGEYSRSHYFLYKPGIGQIAPELFHPVTPRPSGVLRIEQ